MGGPAPIGDNGIPMGSAAGLGRLAGVLALGAMVCPLGCGRGPTMDQPVLSGALRGAPIDGPISAVSVTKAPSPDAGGTNPSAPSTATSPSPTVSASGPSAAPPANPKPELPTGPLDDTGVAIPLPDDNLPQPPPLPAARVEKGFVSTSFDVLSDFDAGEIGQFGPTPEMIKAGAVEKIVPKHIRAMSGKKIGVSGYMIPIDFEKNSVQTFILCRWQPGCCFGHVPQSHEQIFVEMPDSDGTRFVIIPVTVYGTFKVGNPDGDAGGALSLYRLAAEKVVIPEDW